MLHDIAYEIKVELDCATKFTGCGWRDTADFEGTRGLWIVLIIKCVKGIKEILVKKDVFVSSTDELIERPFSSGICHSDLTA
jgi:hypothetical protein